jgi:2-keto-4-pentenoate hydratase
LSDAATDPRVVAALERQLESWRDALGRGAERVGWKIGLNIPEAQERLGLTEPVIGHLTSETRLEPGGTYSAAGAEALHLEPELAIEVGPDESVAGVSPAIELVDVGRPPGGLDGIVAENVFHRAFAIADVTSPAPDDPPTATVTVNGKERESAPADDDLREVVRLVARLLREAGERLEAGDRIIAGSITPQVALEPGDEVAVEVSGLGRVEAAIAP